MNFVVTRGYLGNLAVVVTAGYLATAAATSGISPDLELTLRLFRSVGVHSTMYRSAELDSEMPRTIAFETDLT